MECKEFEKMIPAYFAGELSDRELSDFIRHIEVCGDCREEMVIQFLIAEGVQRLEDGDAFDVQEELFCRLEDSRRKLRRRRYIRLFLLLLEGALVLLLAWIIFSILAPVRLLKRALRRVEYQYSIRSEIGVTALPICHLPRCCR